MENILLIEELTDTINLVNQNPMEIQQTDEISDSMECAIDEPPTIADEEMEMPMQQGYSVDQQSTIQSIILPILPAAESLAEQPPNDVIMLENEEKQNVENIDEQINKSSSEIPLNVITPIKELAETNKILVNQKEDDLETPLVVDVVNSAIINEPSVEEHEEIYQPYNFADKTLIELSRHSWGTKSQNYVRGCLWSPDGTCILVPINRNGIHIIELPIDLYTTESINENRPLDVLTSAIHVPESGIIYDYCWYPFMNSQQPDSCCWITTRQHSPIQMWDAFNGNLRATYRGYDAVDEVEPAISCTFSTDGASIIGGYRKSVKVFRTDLPGRDFIQFPIKSPVSCMAVHSSESDLLAIGSWNRLVNVHDIRSPKLAILDRMDRIHKGGITWLRFADSIGGGGGGGPYLYAGARKDNQLVCWDLRNITHPIFNLHRNVQTNQRIYFDLSESGKWLISGDTDGLVHVWDTETTSASSSSSSPNEQTLLEYKFGLHNDCCNGVSLHPTRPILATGSGQHHFINENDDDSIVNNDDLNLMIKPKENSLIFWWYGEKNEIKIT